MPEFLEVRDVSVAYGDIQALWDVSLDVREGEIVALIGPNGAGKTTLMRAVAGLQPLKAGTIHLGDKALHASPAYRIVDEGVILVPEGRRLFGGLTVLDNLELGAYSKRARAERAETLKLVYELFPLLAERKAPARQHHERRATADARHRARAHGSAEACSCSTNRLSGWVRSSWRTSSRPFNG